MMGLALFMFLIIVIQRGRNMLKHLKKKASKPDFWLTHLIIYCVLLFLSKNNDNHIMMIFVAVTYPLFIVFSESFLAYLKSCKK
jgi:hypothetical protein